MKCMVIDIGKTYSGYTQWAWFHNFSIVDMRTPDLYEEYEIIAEGFHFEYSNYLYGIQDKEGNNFVIDKKGVRVIENIDNNNNYMFDFMIGV